MSAHSDASAAGRPVRARWFGGLLLALVLASGTARAQTDLVKRGEYLTRAADCAACHTVPGGLEFAGGYKFDLPFGTIYGPNITPDKQTGIGDYTDDEFVSSIQRGVGRGGKHLYPAMPYPSYTLMSRDDALAIKAYLFSLKPVHADTPPNEVKFPYNQRWLMVFWNMLNNPDKRFQPDSSKSAEWNRGYYLAEALGHCQQCHTPRDITYGLKTSQAYAGAAQQDWLAYNLTGDKQSGIGGWTDEQLESYLSIGHAAGRGAASGPMAEAVDYSLRYLTREDIHAMGVYLRGVPPIHNETASSPAQANLDPLGARVFQGACLSCHALDGSGLQTPYAALAGSHSVRDPNGSNMLQVLVRGSHIETGGPSAFMPSFGGEYTNEELAAVANYTIGHFGGRTGLVTRQAVQDARPAPQPASAAGAKPGS